MHPDMQPCVCVHAIPSLQLVKRSAHHLSIMQVWHSIPMQLPSLIQQRVPGKWARKLLLLLPLTRRVWCADSIARCTLSFSSAGSANSVAVAAEVGELQLPIVPDCLGYHLYQQAAVLAIMPSSMPSFSLSDSLSLNALYLNTFLGLSQNN